MKKTAKDMGLQELLRNFQCQSRNPQADKELLVCMFASRIQKHFKRKNSPTQKERP